MRRSQSSRHHARPSQSGLPSSDEMGVTSNPRGGRLSIDTSSSGRPSLDGFIPNRKATLSPQDWTPHESRTIYEALDQDDGGTPLVSELRRELRQSEKERERLESLLTSLQAQLAARPSLTKVQSLEKDYNQLELLWHGTQRENERCMAEIERGKRRERILEGELAKLVGDNWMESLNLSAILNPTSGVLPPETSSPIALRSGIDLSASTSNRSPATSRRPTLSSTPAASMPSNPLNDRVLMAQIEQMRSLVLGMDQKLRVRDEKLANMMDQAKTEAKKYEELAASSKAKIASMAKTVPN